MLYTFGEEGEGYVYEDYKEIECEYNPIYCTFIDDLAGWGSPVSTKALMQFNMNSMEQAVLKEYFENYGKSKFPKDSDFIDFTTVTTGPNIYGFGLTEDATCPISGAV